MTLGELTTLCFRKIDEENPLRLPDTPKVVHSPEEEQAVLNEIVDQYAAKCHYSSMLMNAISQVYSTLHEELGLSREEVQKLPTDTPLPPRTNALAEKLNDFPEEITERLVLHIIRLLDGRATNPAYSMICYGHIGPFESFEAAAKWLDENGFRQMRPNYWEKESASTFGYLHPGHRITIPSLRAYVQGLTTTDEMSFVSE